jgi:hypothetical protein
MSRTRLVIEASPDLASEVKSFAIRRADEPDELSITEEILKPEWVQGDVVIIHPEEDYRFVLVRHSATRWACSKEQLGDSPHSHDDRDVDHYFDNGQATALIAGGRVVESE